MTREQYSACIIESFHQLSMPYGRYNPRCTLLYMSMTVIKPGLIAQNALAGTLSSVPSDPIPTAAHQQSAGRAHMQC